MPGTSLDGAGASKLGASLPVTGLEHATSAQEHTTIHLLVLMARESITSDAARAVVRMDPADRTAVLVDWKRRAARGLRLAGE